MIDKDTIIKRWNDQADHMNQWDSLGEEEKIEWAYRQGLEDAAKVCEVELQYPGEDAGVDEPIHNSIKAIRALKEPT